MKGATSVTQCRVVGCGRMAGCIVLSVAVLCVAGNLPAGPQVADNTAADLLISVADAIRAYEAVSSGRGEALVLQISNGRVEVRHMDFAFRGPSSRADSWLDDDGRRGQWTTSWARNDHAEIARSESSALITSGVPSHYQNKLGLDFRPAAFNSIQGRSLEQSLRTLAGMAGAKAGIDEHKVLHVSYQNQEETTGASSSLSMSIDTNDGFRLLSFEDATANLNGSGSSNHDKLQVKWTKYKDRWYPQSAFMSEEGVCVIREGKRIPPEKYAMSLQVDVKAFDPEASVNDNEFTLAGLGTTNGTKVVDRIAGIDYVYDQSADDAGEERTR